MKGNYAACFRAASPGLKSMLVDAQAGNSCVKSLARDSQLLAAPFAPGKRESPYPAVRFFFGETRIVVPSLVEEAAASLPEALRNATEFHQGGGATPAETEKVLAKTWPPARTSSMQVLSSTSASLASL
jgi:hypothetical protein